MEEECTSILLNNAFTTIHSLGATQLRVKLNGAKWVYKTMYNPDSTIQDKARVVTKCYKQTDFGETYTPVGKLTTFRYVITLGGNHDWNVAHLDVVTAFRNAKVDDDDINLTLPEGLPEGLNTPTIIV